MSARQPHELLLAAQQPTSALSGLIPVVISTIGNQAAQTASARDLHAFLKVGKDFSSWIKAQIARARLVDGRDFTCSPSKVSSPSGTKHTVEYCLTIDAGKQVAMMSETDKGLEVREYFIKCERRALAPAKVELSRLDLLEMAMASERERLALTTKAAQLEHQVAEQAPAVAGFDLIANADGTLCIRDAAKALQMRPHKLMDWLVEKKWIYHRPGKAGYLAYQEKIQSGCLKHRSGSYQDPETGEHRISEQVRITGKGLTTLASKMAAPPSTQRKLGIE